MITKVLVVDDSSVMRHLITDIIQEDDQLVVIDTATNGLEAVRKTEDKRPDVIVLDLQMGEYDGYYAVENIMANSPTPILILSALGNSDFSPVHKCLKAGAIDYINKPKKHQTALREINKQIIQKVKAVAQVNLKAKLGPRSKKNQHHHVFDKNSRYQIIVIGASTGGPTAVENVITKLPSNLNLPIVIAQHMPDNFIQSFVDRLNMMTPIPVKKASTGSEIEEGTIYIAPGDQNLLVKINKNGKRMFSSTSKIFKEYNEPSIDCLFLSAAEQFGSKCIGVILTGMGKDGTEGMLSLRNAGGLTIVQDEKTSVVYGMPREAREKGKAEFQLPVNEIAGFMVSALS